MYSFRSIEEATLIQNKENIKEKFTELCQLDDFQKAIRGGLQNKGSILRRRLLWQKLLGQAIAHNT